MTDALVLIAVGLAAAAAIVVVSLPLLRSMGGRERIDPIGPDQRRRLALREERDDALAALRDLEFDHRTGKIADADYAPLVVEYRRRVAAALQALDAQRPPGGAPAPEAGAPDGGASAPGGG